MVPALHRRDVAVAGGAVATWSSGPPLDRSGDDGRVVLALHGITGNSAAWAPVRRALRDEMAVVTPDLRGRGRSNAVDGPFGMRAHCDDQLAVLDALDVDRAVVVGHSMGAYVAARFAAEHPERVAALVLVDGGLSLPPPSDLDVQATLDAVLGPAIARLGQTFASRDEYIDFWRSHPAFGNGQVDDQDLVAYAEHDLTGTPPALRSSVREDAVRADGADVLMTAGDAAHQLAVTTSLLVAPRGLLDEPSRLLPLDLAEHWVAQQSADRTLLDVDDVNHYTIVMGRGAATVAEVIKGYGAMP